MIKESIIYLMNTAIRTVKPCKIRFGHEEYQKGWNDCIKELNKRQKKYVFEFGEYSEDRINKLDVTYKLDED